MRWGSLLSAGGSGHRSVIVMSVIGLPHTGDITLTSWGHRAFSTNLHEYGGEDVVEGCFEEKIDRVIWRIFFPPSSCVHVCVHSGINNKTTLKSYHNLLSILPQCLLLLIFLSTVYPNRFLIYLIPVMEGNTKSFCGYLCFFLISQ